MISYIWEYRVETNNAAAFERAYGSGGPWHHLFRKAPGYIRTELFKDQQEPTRYLSIDYWVDRASLEQFREKHKGEIEDIDSTCETFTISERHIGDFELV